VDKKKSGHAAELNRPADRIAMAGKANFPIVARHLPTFLEKRARLVRRATTKLAKAPLDVPQRALVDAGGGTH
jgi:hypothetical protein